MTVVDKTVLVPYGPRQMYELVANAEAYPEFLPGCRSVEILSRDVDEMKARVGLVMGPVHKKFTTVNRLVDGKRIEIRLVKGPFKHLEGIWQFEPVGDQGCRVSLDLEFELSSRLLAASIGPVFNEVANRLMDAFVRRASELYGKR